MRVETVLIFLGMALVTYLTRYAMMAVLGREALGEADRPSLLGRWLAYVPPAILAALVAPAALAPQGILVIGPHAWATLVGTLVAWRTRNVLLTILGGLAAFWVLKGLGA